MYACADATLDEETIKSTGFSSGGRLFAFIRGSYGLKGLCNFSNQQLPTF